MPKDGSKEPLDIIVVGGSLGGLCAGIALKYQGHNVTICERNPTNGFEDQGAGVVAGGDTHKFFEEYDRCKQDRACPSQKQLYLDKSGKIVHQEDNKQFMTSWDTLYYILRANFDGVESAYCKTPERKPGGGGTRHAYDHNVTGFEERREKIEVGYTHSNGKGRVMTADLLIGSDGPSSTIRKMLLQNVQRRLTGYCALRDTIPENEASDVAKKVF